MSIDVHVVDYQMNTLPKPHVSYSVQVREKRNLQRMGSNKDSSNYIVFRRYTQFKELHAALKKILPKNISMPTLPTQGWRRLFGSKHINSRRLELNQYMIEVMDLLKGNSAITLIMTQPLISFLAKSIGDENYTKTSTKSRPKQRNDTHTTRGSNRQRSISTFHRQLIQAAASTADGTGEGTDTMNGLTTMTDEEMHEATTSDPLQPLANWSGIHLSLITEPRPDPNQRGVSKTVGIGLQRFVCGTCGGKLLNPKQVRWCEYTELYHCSQCCGMRARMVIPTRVLHHWDFLKYRVCDEVASFLEDIYTRPVLCVSALNPQLFDWVSELRHIRLLRLQLIRMKDFVDTCRQGVVLRSRLDERNLGYLMDDTEMYSLRDLFEVRVFDIVVLFSHAAPTQGRRLFGRF